MPAESKKESNSEVKTNAKESSSSGRNFNFTFRDSLSSFKKSKNIRNRIDRLQERFDKSPKIKEKENEIKELIRLANNLSNDRDQDKFLEILDEILDIAEHNKSSVSKRFDEVKDSLQSILEENKVTDNEFNKIEEKIEKIKRDFTKKSNPKPRRGSFFSSGRNFGDIDDVTRRMNPLWTFIEEFVIPKTPQKVKDRIHTLTPKFVTNGVKKIEQFYLDRAQRVLDEEARFQEMLEEKDREIEEEAEKAREEREFDIFDKEPVKPIRRERNPEPSVEPVNRENDNTESIEKIGKIEQFYLDRAQRVLDIPEKVDDFVNNKTKADLDTIDNKIDNLLSFISATSKTVDNIFKTDTERNLGEFENQDESRQLELRKVETIERIEKILSSKTFLNKDGSIGKKKGDSDSFGGIPVSQGGGLDVGIEDALMAKWGWDKIKSGGKKILTKAGGVIKKIPRIGTVEKIATTVAGGLGLGALIGKNNETNSIGIEKIEGQTGKDTTSSGAKTKNSESLPVERGKGKLLSQKPVNTGNGLESIAKGGRASSVLRSINKIGASRALGGIGTALVLGGEYMDYSDEVDDYEAKLKNQVNTKFLSQEEADKRMENFKSNKRAKHGATAVGTLGGGALGAKTGAILGGTIGSVVPGLGTALGAGIGGFAGMVIGSLAGNWLGAKTGDMLDDTSTPKELSNLHISTDNGKMIIHYGDKELDLSRPEAITPSDISLKDLELIHSNVNEFLNGEIESAIADKRYGDEYDFKRAKKIINEKLVIVKNNLVKGNKPKVAKRFKDSATNEVQSETQAEWGNVKANYSSLLDTITEASINGKKIDLTNPDVIDKSQITVEDLNNLEEVYDDYVKNYVKKNGKGSRSSLVLERQKNLKISLDRIRKKISEGNEPILKPVSKGSDIPIESKEFEDVSTIARENKLVRAKIDGKRIDFSNPENLTSKDITLEELDAIEDKLEKQRVVEKSFKSGQWEASPEFYENAKKQIATVRQNLIREKQGQSVNPLSRETNEEVKTNIPVAPVHDVIPITDKQSASHLDRTAMSEKVAELNTRNNNTLNVNNGGNTTVVQNTLQQRPPITTGNKSYRELLSSQSFKIVGDY